MEGEEGDASAVDIASEEDGDAGNDDDEDKDINARSVEAVVEEEKFSPAMEPTVCACSSWIH